MFSPKNSSDLSSRGCCSLPRYSSEKQTSRQPEIDWLNRPPADSLSSVQSRLRPVPAWGHCVMCPSRCWLCLTASWSWRRRLAFWPPPGARCINALYAEKTRMSHIHSSQINIPLTHKNSRRLQTSSCNFIIKDGFFRLFASFTDWIMIRVLWIWSLVSAARSWCHHKQQMMLHLSWPISIQPARWVNKLTSRGWTPNHPLNVSASSSPFRFCPRPAEDAERSSHLRPEGIM